MRYPRKRLQLKRWRAVALPLALIAVAVMSFGCGGGGNAPASTPATSAAATTSQATTPVTPTTTKVTTPTTSKPPASTPRTSSAPTVNPDNPTHLTVDIEQIETMGFKILWLRPLNDVGSIMIVEGTVAAKLWLIKDGQDVLTHEWKDVPFTADNYTLISKGAEVTLAYPNEEEHDYDEPGNLEVTLTLKDGTKLSARLEKISLHPTAIT